MTPYFKQPSYTYCLLPRRKRGRNTIYPFCKLRAGSCKKRKEGAASFVAIDGKTARRKGG